MKISCYFLIFFWYFFNICIFAYFLFFVCVCLFFVNFFFSPLVFLFPPRKKKWLGGFSNGLGGFSSVLGGPRTCVFFLPEYFLWARIFVLGRDLLVENFVCLSKITTPACNFAIPDVVVSPMIVPTRPGGWNTPGSRNPIIVHHITLHNTVSIRNRVVVADSRWTTTYLLQRRSMHQP